jgi:hypothetical protein
MNPSGFDYIMCMQVLKARSREVLLAYAERNEPGGGEKLALALSHLETAVGRAERLGEPRTRPPATPPMETPAPSCRHHYPLGKCRYCAAPWWKFWWWFD